MELVPPIPSKDASSLHCTKTRQLQGQGHFLESQPIRLVGSTRQPASRWLGSRNVEGVPLCPSTGHLGAEGRDEGLCSGVPLRRSQHPVLPVFSGSHEGPICRKLHNGRVLQGGDDDGQVRRQHAHPIEASNDGRWYPASICHLGAQEHVPTQVLHAEVVLHLPHHSQLRDIDW